MNDQKNMLLAIVLSAIVLIAWQFFFGLPSMHQQQQKQQQQQQQQQTQSPVPQPGAPPIPAGQPAAPGTAQPQTAPVPGQLPGQPLSREAALKASPRLGIETPRLTGSINLRG